MRPIAQNDVHVHRYRDLPTCGHGSGCLLRLWRIRSQPLACCSLENRGSLGPGSLGLSLVWDPTDLAVAAALPQCAAGPTEVFIIPLQKGRAGGPSEAVQAVQAAVGGELPQGRKTTVGGGKNRGQGLKLRPSVLNFLLPPKPG